MTKHLLTGTLAILIAGGAASAKTLLPEEALQRVQGSQIKAQALNNLQNAPELVLTSFTESGVPAVYVFGKQDNGYMILSADDIAYPVLAYADNGTFDKENMPEAMKWWLDEYTRQIEYAAANSAALGSDIRPAREQRQAIEPLLKTHWDQGEPYNRLCPVVNGSRGYTGCVATSMAQIMYYFKYPAVGTGKISYNDDEGCGKRLTWDFTKNPFEWDKMLLNYSNQQYTDEQANAVSVMMKSAGAAVKMSYGADSSGALSLMTQHGLVKYLGYDPNLEYVLRSTVSSTKWDELMYENLVNVGPVLYGGGSMVGGGHSFVLDGYDGNGYYHFNWGWSSMSDGYFSLDALNPSALGAGGGTGGGYNFTQDAVLGIQPPTGKPAEERPETIFQLGSLNGTMEGDVLKLDLADEGEPMWVNYNPETVKVRFGMIIEQQNTTNGADTTVAINKTIYSLKPGYGANVKILKPQVDFAALQLPDGVFKITMASLMDTEGALWQPMKFNYGCSNYVVVTKENGKYTVESTKAPFYTIDQVMIDDLYYGCLVNMDVTITNPYDFEISRGIAPLLYTTDGQIAYMGEGLFITLQPHETVTRNIITEMYLFNSSLGQVRQDTDFYLTFFDETSYRIMTDEFFSKVTMHPNPGAPQVTVTPALTIEGAKRVHKVENGTFLNYYEVSNPYEMRVTAGLTLNQGFIAYPIYVCLLTDVDANGNLGIIDYKGDAVFMSEAGQHTDFDVTFNFSSAVPGEYYHLSLAYGVNQSLAALSNPLRFRIADQLGVEDVTDADSDISFDGTTVSAQGEEITVYNLQGVKVAEGLDSVSMQGFTAGVYIAKTPTKSLKIVVK